MIMWKHIHDKWFGKVARLCLSLVSLYVDCYNAWNGFIFIALNKLFLRLMKLEVTSLNKLYDIKFSGFVCAAMILMCCSHLLVFVLSAVQRSKVAVT
jgi:hypothetical protein